MATAKKGKRGRRAYTDEKEYMVYIQFYRKAGDIELIGGKPVARELAENAFDKALAKKIKEIKNVVA